MLNKIMFGNLDFFCEYVGALAKFCILGQRQNMN